MATCKHCGKVEKWLPESWTEWECLLCYLDRYITCSLPVDHRTRRYWLNQMEEGRDKLNGAIVDNKMQLAIDEVDGRVGL